MHVVVMSEISRVTTACISIVAIPVVQSLSPLFERFFIFSGPRGIQQKNVQKMDRLAQKVQLGGARTYGCMSFSKTLVM
jgi:hypothetical protein